MKYTAVVFLAFFAISIINAGSLHVHPYWVKPDEITPLLSPGIRAMVLKPRELTQKKVHLGTEVYPYSLLHDPL